MKKESVEQAAKEYCTYLNEHKNAIANNAFLAGSKWREEQSGWIDIENPPKKPTMILIGYFQFGEFLQDVEFYDGLTKPYYTHWQPLPKNPIV